MCPHSGRGPEDHLTIIDLRAGMESFPGMTNKVTTLVRATGIEDPGRMSGTGTGSRSAPRPPLKARRASRPAKHQCSGQLHSPAI
jgi:hypothetical protein